jgi:hypothetical protein
MKAPYPARAFGLFALTVILISMVFLFGCAEPVQNNSKVAQRISYQTVDGVTVRVWRDPETKCEYLVLYNNSLTPRVDADGLPICGDIK